ncbi:bifunctional DNA-formamidopyrimidine glycosylase/DNA-(apurinic or apyrimidinic site) lyase [Algihabitans albus]|uniref:bifunctional DNA-formamidopyrimidine glycosylase/DNA-(apurinic or apyrimidinic site) lyase n=1 Tax=Algihabitans albus TaxID=2164067 RepID=UPI000E5C6041|nr:bifunctional DNA-formamidopyrimidine glycosylase/DNA-(apurinic or apyrimidinic site) lyase [Algihabitans albus]
MPELPEVETVIRGLRPVLEGRTLSEVVQRRQDLRFPLPSGFADRLTGRRIERIVRRAKYILVHLEAKGRAGSEVLLIHLGMSGRMTLFPARPNVPYLPHDHVVFITDEGREVRFNDARRFGFMDLFDKDELAGHPRLSCLGPEPLSEDFDGAYLAAALAGKSTPIKAALLDQTVVAGLGNIYVCEALYGAGLSPKRLARAVQGGRADRLAAAIKATLTRAIAAGGSSLRDYVQASGELGYFQHEWAVYGKEGEACPTCDCDLTTSGGIRRFVQSGRSTFHCPRHQR